MKHPTHLALISVLCLSLFGSGCKKNAITPAPNYNDSGLKYSGQILFDSSTANDLCTQNAARISVAGSFYRPTEYFDGQVTYSTVPGQAKTTISCSEFQFSATQQVNQKTIDHLGTVSYAWQDVSTASGAVDSSCNLTISAGLDIRGPDHRLIVKTLRAPGGNDGVWISPLSVTCP